MKYKVSELLNNYEDISTIFEAAPDISVDNIAKNCFNKINKGEKPVHIRHIKRFSVLAATLVLVLALSVTAFAIVKSMSLKDRMKEQGIADLNTIESLSTDENDIHDGENIIAFAEDEYAEYKVLEAVCDSQTIRVHAHIVPKEEIYMLITQDVSPSDPAGYLGIPGVTEGTVSEYAESQGKILRYATFSIQNIDNLGLSAECEQDGSLHIYLKGQNTDELIEINAKFIAFTSGIDQMELVDISERTSFEAMLQNKSTLQEIRVFTKFDSRIEDEFGINIEKLTFEETELCYYAVFTYTSENPENIAAFRVVDENGEYFTVRGLGDSSYTENGDGTFTYREPVPKVENPEKLMFKIVDGNFDKFGPFSFEP